MERTAIFECSCGNCFKAKLHDVIGGNTSYCPKCRVFLKSGEMHYDWRGGKSKKSQYDYRNGIEGVRWGRAVKKRDNYTCVECGTTDVEIHAHHIKTVSEYPDLMTDIDNGVTLCLFCHAKKHPEMHLLQMRAKNYKLKLAV